jgi:hypothetical protein
MGVGFEQSAGRERLVLKLSKGRTGGDDARRPKVEPTFEYGESEPGADIRDLTFERLQLPNSKAKGGDGGFGFLNGIRLGQQRGRVGGRTTWTAEARGPEEPPERTVGLTLPLTFKLTARAIVFARKGRARAENALQKLEANDIEGAERLLKRLNKMEARTGRIEKTTKFLREWLRG